MNKRRRRSGGGGEGAARPPHDENEEDETEGEGGERHNVVDPKRLLRQSINSLSHSAGGGGGGGATAGEEILTVPERNFLEMLLKSDDPGVEEACMAAHERLMDGNLFMSWNACGGGCDDGGGEETPCNIREDSVDWAKAGEKTAPPTSRAAVSPGLREP